LFERPSRLRKLSYAPRLVNLDMIMLLKIHLPLETSFLAATAVSENRRSNPKGALIEFVPNVDQPSTHWSHFLFKDWNIAGLRTANTTVLRTYRYFSFYRATIKRQVPPAAPAARAFANANRRGELNGIGGRDIDGAQSTHSDERKQREPTDQSNKQGGRKRVDCCSGAGVCFHPAGVFNLTPRYRMERP
jgi:hypothetical protein